MPQQNDKRPTPTVLAVSQMAFEGHIIPHTWYDHVTYTTNGGAEKVDLQAIIILSDIVYWYRPKRVMDEATGKLLRLERRFSADKLQRNYKQLSEQFGISKTQASRAVKRLRDLGLVTMEFRTVETAEGTLSNVLFLEPIPERLAEITYPHNERVKRSSQICQDPPTNLSTYPDKNARTYTENTPKNTPKKEPTPKAKKPPEEPKEPTPPVPGTVEPWRGPPPPAARVYQSHIHRWPRRTQYRRIHETVGDEPQDLEFWGKVVGKYDALGWNNMNVDGMLEWYERRELPHVTRGNGGNGNDTLAQIDAFRAKLEAGRQSVVDAEWQMVGESL